MSLNTEIAVSEGKTVELGDTLADDKALDLAAWVDHRTFLLSCPHRLIEIAQKREQGQALTGADRVYLWKYREREQKRLL